MALNAKSGEPEGLPDLARVSLNRGLGKRKDPSRGSSQNATFFQTSSRIPLLTNQAPKPAIVTAEAMETHASSRSLT